MSPHLRLACVLLFAIASPASAIGFDDLDFVRASSLPEGVLEVLKQMPHADDYVLSDHLNPYYLQGDYDGDGALDTAVLVRNKSSRKAGIAIVHGRTPAVALLGAGQDLEGMDEFDWMDAWSSQPKGAVGIGVGEEQALALKGDAILAIKTEAASGLIYWDGKRFAWYQQGD
jgi:hypothetical protein